MGHRVHLPGEVLLDSVHVARQSRKESDVVLLFSLLLSSRQLREDAMCCSLHDAYFMAGSQRTEKSFHFHVRLCEALVMEETVQTDERKGCRCARDKRSIEWAFRIREEDESGLHREPWVEASRSV